MTRSIDLDPFDLTIEEKIFRNGKRICIVFAVAAISISALDLMNVRAVEAASEFIRDSRLNYAEIPGRVLTAIRQISILPEPSSVVVAIPRDVVVAAPKIAAAPAPAPKIAIAPAPKIAAASPPPAAPKNVTAKPDSSPVAELAAARHWDAVEFAMAAPAVMEKPRPAALAVSSPIATSAPIQLASIDPGSMPTASIATASISPSSISPNSISPNSISPLPISIALPAKLSIMPPPAPGVPPPSPAQRLKLEGTEYAKAERCLANAIYFESRSEPLRGQIAVAQVVINRVFSPFYPNDVCGVVYQNAHRRLSCQFTFACDGKSKAIHERGAWARANRIAKQAMHGQLYLPDVGTSTHYHATYVNPYWVREMRKNVRYGIHNFYRPIAWGNGANEPVWARAALDVNKKR